MVTEDSRPARWPIYANRVQPVQSFAAVAWLALCALMFTTNAWGAAQTWTSGSGTWKTGASGWNNSSTTWTAGDTANFAGSDGTYAIAVGGAISTAHGSSATPAIKFSNSGYTLSASSAQTITMNNDGNAMTYIAVASTKTGTIGNNVTLTKQANNGAMVFFGGGTLTVASGAKIDDSPNNNTLSVENATTLYINGGTVISGSSFIVGNLNSLGANGTLTIDSGALTLGAFSGTTGGNLIVGRVAGETSVANLNGGTVTCLAVTKTAGTGTIYFNGGTLKAKASATAAFFTGLDNAYVKSGGVTFDNNGQALTIGQALLTDTVSTGGGLTLSDSAATKSTLTLSGANTYTGPTTLTGGTLNAGVAQNGSTSGPLGVSGNIIFGGGTLQFSSASASWDPSARIASGTSSGAVSIDPNGQSVTLGTGLTSSQSGGLTLNDTASTKGKLTLSAANAYTGNTTITAGTLLVNNSTGSGTGSGSVSVSGTLGGSGTISGTVTVNSGGFIAPGDPSVSSGVGTITVGALTLASGSKLNYEITSTSTLDKTVVTGSGGLTINGGAIYLYQPGTANPFTANGTYNLIQYSGTIAGTGTSALSVGNQQAGKTYTFDTSGGYVRLTIADSVSSSYWNVDANGSWATAGNWTIGGVPNASGATANFGGGGTAITAPRTVTLDGSETVGGLNFNSAQSFTINQGTSGTLTLDNGASAAQIVESVGSHTIGAPVSVPAAGASFSVASSTTLALNGVVSGSGNITNTGPGTLTLGGSDSFNGGMTISGGGTVQYTGSGANSGGGSYVLSGASSMLTLNTTGTVTSSGLTIDRTSADVLNLTAGTLTVGASGVATSGASGSSGKINFSGGTLKSSAGFSIAGNIAVNLNTDGAVIDTTGGSIASSSSFLVGSGMGNLTVQGGNTLTLPSGNTYSGSTLIQGNSTLKLGASTLPGVVTVNSGSTFDLNNASSSIGGLTGAGTVVNASSSAKRTFTLTGTGGNSFSGAINPASGDQANTAVTVNLSSGTQTFSGANSYSGGTTISGGTLALSGSGTLGGGGLTMSGGTLDLGGLTSLSVGAVSISGAATIQNGSLTGTSYAASLTSGNATVTANLLGSGVGLTMSGTGGTLMLSGANTYSGGTTVNNGVLALNHDTSDNNPAITGNVNLNGGASSARGQIYLMRSSQLQSSATIVMNANNYYCDLILGGNSQTVASISTTGTSPGNNYCYIENSFNALGSSATGTLTINNSSLVTLGAYTYVRDTAGTGLGKLAIILAGSSTVVAGAGAASTIINTGGWTLQSGTLQLAGSAFASTVPFTLQGGTLESDTAGTARSISGNLTFAGNMTLGDATLNGALTLGTAGTGTATISGSGISRTFTVNSAVTINSPIGDGGNANGITKAGSGALTLIGANTYAGNTTISAGTLALSGVGSINNSVNVVVSSGATFDVSAVTGGYSLPSGKTITGKGTVHGAAGIAGMLAPGADNSALGTLTFDNALTLSGNANFRVNRTTGTLTSDQVAGATSVAAGGTLNVSLNTGSEALQDGDNFTLFNVQPGSTFTTVNLPNPGIPYNWNTANNYRTISLNLWPTAGTATFHHNRGIQQQFKVSDLLSHITGATSGKTITLTSVAGYTDLTTAQTLLSGATLQASGPFSNGSTLILYTPASTDNGDSLTYAVNDGRGGTPSGTVSLVADTGSVFGQQSPQMTADGNGNITIKFYGVPGYSYYVQRADDIGFTQSLTELGPYNATTGDPVISLTNSISPSGQAYYRLEWRP